MLLAALASLAIVIQDQTILRAAPRDSAQQQTVLWQGDLLEVRGSDMNFLQVYDHRHERAGYVRATQVRVSEMTPEQAPELLSVVHYLTNLPGSEATGIAYAAAYLKVAPAQDIRADVFDALGTMSERLARRASRSQKTADVALAAQLEVVASYGVVMRSIERDGRMQWCYDGDAFRRVLSLPASDEIRARAALSLTRHDCQDPGLNPFDKFQDDNWRADILDRVNIAELPAYMKNRLHLRKAGVWASLAFERTRHEADVKVAATRAIEEYAAVNKSTLSEDDIADYNETAIRVGASRWAAEDEPPVLANRVSLITEQGEPGETCISLVDGKQAMANTLFRRCTYAKVWVASARVNADSTVMTLAVQPLATWRELWVLQRRDGQWGLDVIPPSVNGPDLGYLEFAGWVPASHQMLAVREAKIDGRNKTSFEVIDLDSLQTLRLADKPNSISTFYRWQDAQWKRQTLSLR